MRGAKLSSGYLYAYKWSAALFCCLGALLIEIGIYWNPTMGPSIERTIAMVIVFIVSVLEWRMFFVGKFGTAIYKGSLPAYLSIITFFICGVLESAGIFVFHKGLIYVVGILAASNGLVSINWIEKMKIELNKDTDFFKVYFDK